MSRRLFCSISPMCYKISEKKEFLLKDVKDFVKHYNFATEYEKEKYPVIIKRHFSLIVRKLHGVDIEVQKRKKINIEIACKKINGIVIKPGEIFSFWKLVGNPSKENGFEKALVIAANGFGEGYGGGLCQMANMIHYLVLHSPLEVVEMYHHSDCLFPDYKRRVPFGTGTSVCYKSLDYRFRNNTSQNVSINVWVEGEYLYGELRGLQELPYRYKLVEVNHHYHKENEKYYRISQIYREKIDKRTKELLEHELILNNHSGVMYDYSLIPKEEIR